MDDIDIGTVRMLIQVGVMLVGIGVLWGWVKFGVAPRVVECAKRMDKFEEGRDVALIQLEDRVVKKIEGVHDHIDEDTKALRNDIGVLFSKVDRLRDSIGDTKIVLTVMAGKVGNPGNDKNLIEMIRDIGTDRSRR